MKIRLSLALGVSLAIAQTAFAAEQVGMLTQIQGEVKIFSHPGKTMQGPPPHALFEGEYFSVRDAKIGDKVERDNIVRTAPGAKARVIYDNGDQLHVGPGSAYRVSWNEKAKGADAKPEVSLMYGKLRGVVEKGGLRSKLMIRTRSATMGVRGTDFFVADGGSGPHGGTEISVLRGEVSVQPKAAEGAKVAPKAIAVKSGSSAEIAAPAKVSPKVELRATTQEDIAGIATASKIEKPVEAPAEAAPEAAKLEQKAVETTMKDIRKTDAKLYAKLQAAAPTSIEQVNLTVTETLAKEAPKAPAKRKPYKSELDDLEQGAYEQYFKKVD